MTGIAAKWGVGKPGTDKPLQEHVNWYVRQGYRITAQTDISTQLIKPKVFSFAWAFIWFLGLGVGVLVYIFYYMAKKDKAVYLTISDGKVQTA